MDRILEKESDAKDGKKITASAHQNFLPSAQVPVDFASRFLSALVDANTNGKCSENQRVDRKSELSRKDDNERLRAEILSLKQKYASTKSMYNDLLESVVRRNMEFLQLVDINLEMEQQIQRKQDFIENLERKNLDLERRNNDLLLAHHFQYKDIAYSSSEDEEMSIFKINSTNIEEMGVI